MSRNYSEFEQRLFGQSFRLFTQHGVKAYTVEELASQLGVSKKTIYSHVSSRDELLQESFEYRFTFVEQSIEEIINSDSHPVQQFLRVGEFIAEFVSDIKVDRIVELKGRYPHIWKMTERFRSERRKQFMVILEQAREKGLVKQDINIESFTLLLMHMINSVFQPEYFVQSNAGLPETIRLFFRIISNGIFTTQGMEHASAI